MKKIVILLGLLMVFNGCAYAAQDEVLPLKVSDVKVFSDDGYFGLKDKNGNQLYCKDGDTYREATTADYYTKDKFYRKKANVEYR